MKSRRNSRRRRDFSIEQLEQRCLLAATSLVPASVISGTTTTGNGSASGGSVSADGRFTVYTSESTNIVTGQVGGPGTRDVFLYDSVTHTVTLVSHAFGAESTAANGDSDTAVISADGQYIAYLSAATNLVEGQVDQNQSKDLFLLNRSTGITQLVSRAAGTTATAGNNASGSSGFTFEGNPALSADGHYLAFVSTANDLVADQQGGGSNVYLFDTQTNGMQLVSSAAGTTNITANGSSLTPVISGNGRFVAYTSGATNIVPGQVDGNSVVGGWDVFLFDRDAAQNPNVLVSGSGGSTTVTANVSTFSDLEMSLSDNGRFLVFKSFASDLISGVTDENGNSDIFIFDRESSPGFNITLVSHAANSLTTAATGGSSSSETPVISADGLYVAYKSTATNIVANDANNSYDVFVYSLLDHTNVLASHVSGGSASAAGDSTGPLINADGSRVIYSSQAWNLVPLQSDLNGNYDVFVFDRAASVNTLASGAGGSATTAGNGDSLATAVSSDGLTVVLASLADNLAGTDSNAASDVYVRQSLVPTFSIRAQSYTGDEGDGTIRIRVDRSGDTSVAAAVDYQLYDSYLLIPVDHPATPDVDYVNDEGTLVFAPGETSLTFDIIILDDHVLEFNETFFVALTETTPGAVLGANMVAMVNIRDDDGIELISVNAAGDASGNKRSTLGGVSRGRIISDDGRFVLFSSSATDLVPGMVDNDGLSADVYVRDRLTEETILVSRNAQGTGTGNGDSDLVSISPNGVFVLFRSYATDLVSGVSDTNEAVDLFVFNLLTRTSTLVSCLDSNPLVTGNYGSYTGQISDDGRFVAFASSSSNLIAGVTDLNQNPVFPDEPGDDIFIRDLHDGTTTLISRSTAGNATGNLASNFPQMSADGRFVAFTSQASDLASGIIDSNGKDDLFVWDRLAPFETGLKMASVNRDGNGSANSEVGSFDLSRDGSALVIQTRAKDMMFGVVDEPSPDEFHIDGSNLYYQDLRTGTRQLISHVLGQPLVAGNHTSFHGIFSGDGRYVVFGSSASDLVEGTPDNPGSSIYGLLYRYNVSTRLNELVAPGNNPSTIIYNSSLERSLVSNDGRFIVFETVVDASLITDGVDDINQLTYLPVDTYLRDMDLGTTTLISRTATTTAETGTSSSTISGNGKFVIFESESTKLVDLPDVNNMLDEYGKDVFVFPGQFNPGTFQFTSAEVSVSEESSELVLTIERTGGTNGSFLLELATTSAGGTATANVDYLSTIRQILFADGQTTAELHINLQDDAEMEANETFQVTLNVVGYDLVGQNSVATVTIVDNDTPVVGNQIVEPDGDVVSVTLKGPGSVVLSVDDPDGDGKGPIQILLVGTSADKSSLSFKVSANKTTGNGYADIALIVGNGGLKTLSGSKVNLVGPGIALTGKVLSLTLHDVKNGADIAVGGSPSEFMTLTLHDVADGTNISVGSGIKTLTAARIGAGIITAPSLQTMNIKGDAKAGILGDIHASVLLSGQGVTPERTTLGKATIAHAMIDAVFAILGGPGGIGTITTGEMKNSGISAGYLPADLSKPLNGGTFPVAVNIGSVIVKGIKGGGPAFSNSTIAASRIGSVTIASIDLSDSGEFFMEKYGVIADVAITRVFVTAQNFAYNPFGATDQTTDTASRFHVKVI